eukprot:15424768-Alexandrium_andersonii.AAC.1
MAGVAHHQEVVARRQMQKCVDMYDAAPAPERPRPVCRALLDPASPARRQLAAASNGAPVSEQWEVPRQ